MTSCGRSGRAKSRRGAGSGVNWKNKPRCCTAVAARQAVAEGRALSDAFERHGLSTPIARRLLRVAERSGAMGEMLERTATFHDEDIAQEIEWAVRLAEPLLMVGIGIVIGFVVLLMYAPIFELAGSLQ